MDHADPGLPAVVHNQFSGVHACTMIFDPDMSVTRVSLLLVYTADTMRNTNRSMLASSSAWLPLLYDTAVLGLTIWRTLPAMRNRNASYVMKRLLEDGLIYYTYVRCAAFLL